MVKKALAVVLCAPALLFLACSSAPNEPITNQTKQREIFCPDDWVELTVNPGQPLNAVGLLNNGCTAFLIDANHIAAAAHCFADSDNGSWQPNLRFYPNFHPSRTIADPNHVPRYDVTRAVVGQRQWYTGENGNDWGIAYVNNPRDTTGLDLTPVTLQDYIFPPYDLYQVGYPRSYFQQGDVDSILAPGMIYEHDLCRGGPWDGCWEIQLPQFPGGGNAIPAGETVGCNKRWQYGQKDFNCLLTYLDSDGFSTHNCDNAGGNSGSPVFQVSTGNVIAVTSGHAHAFCKDLQHAWQQPDPCSNDVFNPDLQSAAATAYRFINAPRFARNVAIANRSDGTAATSVFATDADMNRVVYRERQGTPPTVSTHYDRWLSLGAPTGAAAPDKIAACNLPSGKPKVFAEFQTCPGRCNSHIYTRESASGWTAWSDFGLPSGVASVYDVDAAYDVANSRCQLFMVGSDGALYTRRMATSTTWNSNWEFVASGTYRRVTAIKEGALLWTMTMNFSGAINASKFDGTTWTVYAAAGFPSGVTAWVDMDFGFDPSGGAVLYAYAGNGIFSRAVAGGAWPWWNWRNHDLYLNQPYVPDLTTITASRWLESGTYAPMLFGTDSYGEVYVMKSLPFWAPYYNDWFPFYPVTGYAP